MATRKSPKKKKPAVRPEAVFRARPKPVTQKPASKKQPLKKRHKKQLGWLKAVRRFGHKHVPRRLFVAIVAIVLTAAVIATGVLVQESVSQTNQLLTEAAEQANNSFLIAKKEADLVRIIGTKTKRQSEITNYQSASAGLQSFMNADYRQFKASCIANGSLPSDVGYEVTNVIYDSFAVIKRTCNGTDTVILKKFDSGWAIVFSGNVLPACSLVNDFAIPQGASYHCEQNGVTYLNPNP